MSITYFTTANSIASINTALAAASPGDIFRFAPGTYDISATQITIGASGTNGNPIIIEGFDINDPYSGTLGYAIFDGGYTTDGGAALYGVTINGKSDVSFRNIQIKGVTDGVWFRNACSRIKFSWCKISNIVKDTGTSAGNGAQFENTHTGSGVEFEYCLITDTWQDGISPKGAGTGYRIHDNVIRRAGVAADGTIGGGSAIADCISAHDTTSGQQWNNDLRTCTQGCILNVGTATWYAWGNFCANFGYCGVGHAQAAGTTVAFNNIIVQMDRAAGLVSYPLAETVTANLKAYYNTIILNDTSSGAYGCLANGSAGGTVELFGNIFYRNGNNPYFVFKSTNVVVTADRNIYYPSTGNQFNENSVAKTFAQWKAIISGDANSIQSDPLFVNAAGMATGSTDPTTAAPWMARLAYGSPAVGLAIDYTATTLNSYDFGGHTRSRPFCAGAWNYLGAKRMSVSYTDTYSTAGTYSWTAPQNLSGSTASVVVIGSGGGGGEGGIGGGGGGGGGASAITPAYPVVAGAAYPLEVGAGGAAKNDGRQSTFDTGSGTDVVAQGGNAGLDGSDGAGGAASGGTGTTNRSGGDGAAGGGGGEGGGGGGGATSSAAGTNGAGTVGGVVGGGAGGAALGLPGAAATGAGGGGGGAGFGSTAGAGYDGSVAITYSVLTAVAGAPGSERSATFGGVAPTTEM